MDLGMPASRYALWGFLGTSVCLHCNLESLFHLTVYYQSPKERHLINYGFFSDVPSRVLRDFALKPLFLKKKKIPLWTLYIRYNTVITGIKDDQSTGVFVKIDWKRGKLLDRYEVDIRWKHSEHLSQLPGYIDIFIRKYSDRGMCNNYFSHSQILAHCMQSIMNETICKARQDERRAEYINIENLAIDLRDMI